MKKNFVALLSLVLSTMITIVACSPPATTDLAYEVIQEGYKIEVSGNPYDIPTDNCGSSRDSAKKEERSQEYVVEIRIEISDKILAEFGGDIKVAEAMLGKEIGKTLGLGIGAKTTATSAVEITTPAGKKSITSVQWKEVWTEGKIAVIRPDGTYVGAVPFAVLNSLTLEQLSSQTFDCTTGDAVSEIITPEYSCSFIDVLFVNSAIIKKLDIPTGSGFYGGVQARLVRAMDVPVGWIVDKDGVGYEGPLHLEAGVVASFWSPESCRPLNLGTSSSENNGVTDQQAQCEWLEDNFPQSPEEVKRYFDLPEDATISFIYEICPSIANAFGFKASTPVELLVPSGGCIDSWAGFTEYIDDVGTPVPDGTGGWRVYKGTVRAPEMTYRIIGCTQQDAQPTLCAATVTRADVQNWATVGSTDKATVQAYINEFKNKMITGSGSVTGFNMGDTIPVGTLIVTDFGNGESEDYLSFPVNPIVHYRSWGFFEVTNSFVVPNADGGWCATIR